MRLAHKCAKCGATAPHSGWCSDCSNAKAIKTKTDLVNAAKADGCTDCGLEEPAILEFDHVPERGPKLFKIHPKARVGVGKLITEMKKCDVVCPNCHTRRTNARRES